MNLNRYIRQSGLVDHTILSTPINVIGAGGIGSFTVLTLTKMGFNNVHVFDGDTIEEHNLSNQFYRTKDIGKHKVVALTEIVKDFCDINIGHTNDMWTPEDDLNGVVVSALDNMTTRRAVYNKCKRNNEVIGIVDGRMGGNQAEVYTVNTRVGEDKKVYKKTLWAEAEADNTPCTERSVMYNVLWIASTIANSTRMLLTGIDYHRINIMDLQNMMLVQPDGR